MKLIQTIVALCAIGFFLFLGQHLVPVINEWFGEAEKEEKIKEKAKPDVEACGQYTPNRIGGVLYCKCNDDESQKPGKCNEKYK